MSDQPKKHLIVAIDGPAGSGKSTVARRLANRLRATFLDTGAIYRALALLATRRQVSWDDEEGLAAVARSMELSFQSTDQGQRVWVGHEDISEAIRLPEISRGSSAVSRHPAVRQALLVMQRRFADVGGLVAEGRDIGTVVFPSASVKVFLTATEDERARRRFSDLSAAGHDATLAEVLVQQRQRDEDDSTRSTSPLRPADDAMELDTTGIPLDEVVERIYQLCLRTD